MENLEKIYQICAAASFFVLAVMLVVFIIKLKKGKAFTESYSEEAGLSDNSLLMKYPAEKIKKPLVPKGVSVHGIVTFFLVFSLSGLFNKGSGLPVVAGAVIAVCLGIASEIAVSLIVYSFRLKYDKSIIFVPRAIGLNGIVVKDIPARQHGQGAIRLIMNGSVTQINALSVDETILSKGTNVKVVYADSDRVVIVEKSAAV